MGFFTPRCEPARTIYNALGDEQEKRDGKDPDGPDGWIAAERNAVWCAARDYAEQHGLRVPTLAEIERVERQAEGHCDYTAKYAYGVAELLRLEETLE